jgi:hypothetical protein
VGELALMGMIKTNATAMIPAVTGYEVVSIEAAGEVARWPIIGWGIVPHYGYGDSGCIRARYRHARRPRALNG